jgi:hypothetical protein
MFTAETRFGLVIGLADHLQVVKLQTTIIALSLFPHFTVQSCVLSLLLDVSW